MKPKNIFVCSMADLFGKWVPDEWIDEVFTAYGNAPQHRYLFLTKNPARYKELAEAGKIPAKDNMWYGSTATNPDKDIVAFSEKFNTFVSIEPMLERFGKTACISIDYIKWVIIGAETGKKQGKVIPEAEWIHEISDYCRETGKPVFMKDSLIPIVGEEKMIREFPWKEDAQ